MFCSQCGRQAKEGASFCGSCGNPISGADATVGAAPAEEPTVSAATQSEAPRPAAGVYAQPPIVAGGDVGRRPVANYGPPVQPPAGTGAPGYGQYPPAGGQPPYPPSGGYGAPGMYAPAPRYFDSVTQLPLAPWWKRLVAILIDGAVTVIPMYIVFAIFAAIAFSSTTYDPSNGTFSSTPFIVVWIGYLIAIFLVPGVYYAAMHSSRRGQTVGKMAMGIAVRDSHNTGGITFGRAYGRWAILIPMALTFGILTLIDGLSPLWDQRRQAWHDKVAHTIVVEVR